MKKIKENKQGISLILLVITIIVMIILATAVVLTLSNSGIISKANDAVDASDLAQMQNAATLVWSDIYMEGKRGTELKNIVEEKLKLIDGNYEQKYDIEITDYGISVKSKDAGWTTLYEGELSTNTGTVTVANEHIFSLVKEYRITLEGKEYTGTIRFTPALYRQMYALAAVENNMPITVKSAWEVDVAIGQLTEEAVMIAAQHTTDSSGNKVSNILFIDKNMWLIKDEYKITKIEVKDLDRTILFAGDLEAGKEYVIDSADVTHNYVIKSSLGDAECILDKPEDSYYAHVYIYSNCYCNLKYNSDGTAVLESTCDISDVVIYDLGKNQDMVRDGKYIATYGNNNWTLIFWDDNVKTVPQTIEGKPITAVRLSGNSIYYDRELELFFEGFFISDPVHGNIEVAAGVKPDEIFNALKGKSSIDDVTIDLSAISGFTIPPELLSHSSDNLKIYVSSEVKSNYATNDVVQVKQ